MAVAKLHLVCGSDEYRVATKAKEIAEAWVPEADRALGLEIVDGRVDTVDAVCAAIGQCIEALQTVGFFGGGKTVWLRDATFLAGGGRSFESALVKERIADLTALVTKGLAADQALLVSACAVPRNSAFYKAFQNQKQVTDFGSDAKPADKRATAYSVLDEALQRCELTMSASVKEKFMACIDFDSRTITQEVEKLRLYRGSPGAVANGDIEAITSISKGAEAWDVTDALGERNRTRLIAVLRLLEKLNTPHIIISASLDNRIRELILLRAAVDNGWAQASPNSIAWRDMPPEAEIAFSDGKNDLRRQHPFRVAKLAQQARNYTMNELRMARHLLMTMREKMVSSPIAPYFLLETTLLKIVGAPRGKP